MAINFDLNDLLAFRAVAELSSFRKAAESVHLSQPAFSRRIDKLEQALGVRLLERTTRRVTLTAVGRDFERKVRELLDDLDATLLGIRGVAATRMGEVTVACVPSTVYYYLSHVIRRYHERSPKVRVKVLDAGANEVLAAVSRGEADFGLNFMGAQEGDLEFINRLAGRNGFETFVTGRTLHFRPSQNQGGGVVTLEWGKSLLHFKPEGNIAGQISGVEVYGWNPKTKKEIVGKATHGDEPGRDAKRDSGGDKVTKILRDQPVLRVRQPVFSQAEATTRAQALLKERADQFLIGSGETLGVPDLVPGCNVELKGLGKKFSKTYYVRQATHRFDSSGYRTTFKVKEPTL